MSFVAFRKELSPPPLRNPQGRTWDTALGNAEDETANRARDAVAARMPGVAPDDALPSIGLERGIEQGVSETNPVFRERLMQAHVTWREAGTARGMLRALVAAGYAGATLMIANRRQYTLVNNELVITTLPYAKQWCCSAYEPAAWNGFDLYFDTSPGLPIAYGPLAHSGTGAAGAILAWPSPPPDPSPIGTWRIKVVGSGNHTLGGVAFSVSLDGGSWTVPVTRTGNVVTMADAGFPVVDGYSNIAVNLVVTPAPIPFVDGDIWTFEVRSPRIRQLQRIVAAWHPGFAFGGITVRVGPNGEIWGWRRAHPVQGGDQGTWGEAGPDSGLWTSNGRSVHY